MFSTLSNLRISERWISVLLPSRWFLLLIWIGLLIASCALLPKLDFRFNIGQMLRGDDATMEEVKTFYRMFPPSDGHLMVTATSKATLTIDQLRQTAAWARTIEDLPEVKTVISASQLLNLEMDGFTLDQWAQLGGTGQETIALGDGKGMETFKGNLVSRDLKSVALYLIKENGIRQSALQEAVEENVAPPWEDAEMRIVGPQYLLSKMGVLLEDNFYSLIKIQGLALMLIIPFFMRSLRRAYLPLFSSFSALVFYIALFILFDKEFGVMHLAGPGLILIIGLADAIHLQQKFDLARAAGKDVRDSLVSMFRTVGKACGLTSLTTACGFLSLTIARQEEVHDFGIWCAIGVGVSYVTVMLFVPVALAILPGKSNSVRAQRSFPVGSLRRFAAPLTVVLVVLSAGIFRTTIDSSLERELPEDVKIVRDTTWFAENFRGLDRIEVDLHANLRDPEVFNLVEEMQEDLRDFPGISGSRSYVDAIRMMLAPEVVETDDGPILGIQALGSNAFPANLLSRDLNRACIVFYRTGDFGTGAYEEFRERVAEYAEMLPDGSKMKLNGHLPMFYESTTLISKTLALSLACSLFMITVILIVVLRSFKLAMLCLVPNAVPLLVVAGISGWLGESLHIGILIVFSVGLGLAVDDTIHLMVRFKQLHQERPGSTLRELIDEAVHSSGQAILLTSLVLLIASLCYVGSTFTTLQWTGVTLGIVAVTALLADLIVLPWLVEKFHRIPAPSTSAADPS